MKPLREWIEEEIEKVSDLEKQPGKDEWRDDDLFHYAYSQGLQCVFRELKAREDGEEMSERKLLLQLCASLALADHLGDVGEDVNFALKKLGIAIDGDGDWWDAVGDKLHALGVSTLYGTAVRSEEIA